METTDFCTYGVEGSNISQVAYIVFINIVLSRRRSKYQNKMMTFRFHNPHSAPTNSFNSLTQSRHIAPEGLKVPIINVLRKHYW